jgi:DNA-binding MarR family transcriptional regulator
VNDPTNEPVSADDLSRALRPSGAFLAAQIAIGAAIDAAIAPDTDYDRSILDLLVRLAIAPGQHLRGVDLCSQMLRSPSHVSRLTDTAEDEGLVERMPDPRDRRAHQIALTVKGRQAVEAIAGNLVAVTNDVIFSVLSADEIDVLVTLLERITSAAKARLMEFGTTR